MSIKNKDLIEDNNIKIGVRQVNLDESENKIAKLTMKMLKSQRQKILETSSIHVTREIQKPDRGRNSKRNEELNKILLFSKNIDVSSRAFKFILIIRSRFFRMCDCDYSQSLSMIMCIQNLLSICIFVLKILSKNLILTSIKGRSSVANLRKTMIYITNVDFVNDYVYTKIVLNRSIRFQEQKLNSDVNQGP